MIVAVNLPKFTGDKRALGYLYLEIQLKENNFYFAQNFWGFSIDFVR
jgi:hypothetical protein